MEENEQDQCATVSKCPKCYPDLSQDFVERCVWEQWDEDEDGELLLIKCAGCGASWRPGAEIKEPKQ